MDVHPAKRTAESVQDAPRPGSSGIFPRHSGEAEADSNRACPPLDDEASGRSGGGGGYGIARPPQCVLRNSEPIPSNETSPSLGECVASQNLIRPRRGAYLGRYQILERVGTGGTSSVYLAVDRRLGSAVALKVLEREGERARVLFEAEAMATAQCHHEHVVAVHDLLEIDGRTLMVLEYVPGTPLSTLLAQGRALAQSMVARVMRGLLSALAQVHEAGFVHCDVKPANIIVGPGHAPKLIDFGIAQAANRRSSFEGSRDSGVSEMQDAGCETRPDQTGPAGTMHYMAPEQWDVSNEFDSRTDIWAAGLLLFEMLSGHHPLLFARHGRAGGLHPSVVVIPKLEEAIPGAPGLLSDLIASCLECDRRSRTRSARVLLRQLDAIWEPHFRRDERFAGG